MTKQRRLKLGAKVRVSKNDPQAKGIYTIIEVLPKSILKSPQIYRIKNLLDNHILDRAGHTLRRY